MSTKSSSKVRAFVPAGSELDVGALSQIGECMLDDRAVAGALMADHHLGYSMPIGGVIAYDGAVSPSGVGFDIACGNKAVRTELVGGAEKGRSIVGGMDVERVMREVSRRISFGMGRANETPIDHEMFETHRDVIADLDRLTERRAALSQRARAQLGTVGSGNHYVDLLVDEGGRVWVANHFGSRGFGHTIASGFLNLAASRGFDNNGKESEYPTVLDVDTDLGAFYLAAMQAAGDYAYAGRDYVIDQVLDILGRPAVTETVHNHHNFAWLEDGLWVVRKGATPLTTSPAFIGGSMADWSVIVRGKTDGGAVEDIGALGSAPHGAGRVMSRTKAAGKLRKMWVCPNRNCDFPPERCDGFESGHPSNKCPRCSIPLRRERIRDANTGAVDWPLVQDSLSGRGITLLGGGADEAPEVYKKLGPVLAAHSNIEVMHRLRPVGVVMAGADTYDPYRD